MRHGDVRPGQGFRVEPLEGRVLLDAVYPDMYEQYMLELINQGRADPLAEVARTSPIYWNGAPDLNEGLAPGTISTAPKQPLAFNPLIIDAARNHSDWMLLTDTFSHYEGADPADPPYLPNPNYDAGDRMQTSGYVFSPTYWIWGENIAWRGTTGTVPVKEFIEQTAGALFGDKDIDGRGHRTTLMEETFREIGVGIRVGQFTSGSTTYNTVMVAEDFARSGYDVFLTGVAYDDVGGDGDDFYTPGEGQGGVSIQAVRQSDSAAYATTTWASGGYSLILPTGTYTVTASSAGLGVQVFNSIVIGASNVKVDVTWPSAVNTPPTAQAKQVTTPAGTPAIITLVGTDAETDRAGLTFNVPATSTMGGQLVKVGHGQYRYTPPAGYSGADAFTFTVTDDGNPSGSHANPGDLTSAPATVSLTVTATNDVPTAHDQQVTTPIGTAVVITLGADDAETARADLAFNVPTVTGAGGRLTAVAHGQYRYDPPAGYIGSDAFDFTVTDDGDPSGSHANPGDLTSPSATVSLYMAPTVTVEASSQHPFCPPQRLVDGSGLSDGSHSTYYADMWLSEPGASPTLRFDLGQTVLLSEMRVWNYNQVSLAAVPLTNRGVQTCDVYVSVTGIGDPTSNPSGWTLLSDDLQIAQATGAANYAGASYELSAEGTAARYVLLTSMTNWGGTHTGLSEVRFRHLGAMVQGVWATASSQHPFLPPQRLVDGSGLSDGSHNTHYADMWLSEPGASPTLRFDLGGTYLLSEMRVWNYNQVSLTLVPLTNRGVRTADVYVSVTGVGDPTSNPSGWRLLSNDLLIAEATGDAQYAGASYELSSEGTAARYVLLTSMTNWGGTHTGLSEVRFHHTGAVVEIASVTASSQHAYCPPRGLVDGAGLLDGWHHNTHYGDMWLSEPGASPTLRFDLGGVFLLSEMRVWNYNQVSLALVPLTDRGVRTADVYVSATGLGDPTTNPPGWTLLSDDLQIAQATGQVGYAGTAYELSLDGIAARYVLMTDMVNWGGTHTGLSEVRFIHEGPASPGDRVDDTSAAASSQNSFTPAQRLVDGSGLTDGWRHSTHFGDMWLSEPGASPTLRFDLGQTVLLSEMRVWNYNQVSLSSVPLTDRGVRTADVYVSVTGLGDPTGNPSGWTLLSDDLLVAEATGTGQYAGTSYRLSADGIAARFVLMTDMTNWGGTHTGLSEVQFHHVGAVVQGASATASSQNSFTPAQRQTDGSGLSDGWRHSTDFGDMWLSEPGAWPVLRFDLGQTVLLSGMRVWNYNQVGLTGTPLTNRGVRTADVYVSTTGVGNPTGNPSGWTLLSDDMLFAEATGQAEYAGTSYKLSADGITARYVLLTNMTNWGGTHTGLSEVRFWAKT